MKRAPFHSRRRGFTLIEVLLALVLLAALLAALNQFIFSITEVWTRHQEEFVFVQHARAVSRHVGEMLQVAAGSAHSSGTTNGAPMPADSKLPEGGTDMLLQFSLPAGDRLLRWPSRPLPDVQCALAWRKDEGLVLYWKSKLELDFDTGAPRMTVISPYVTALTYDYYDDTTDTWTNEPALRTDPSGAQVAPMRLRLHFHRGRQDTEEVVMIPDASVEGVPAY